MHGKAVRGAGHGLPLRRESCGQVTAGQKHFATINTKIVIFPDKAYYDTATEEFGSLEAEYMPTPAT